MEIKDLIKKIRKSEPYTSIKKVCEADDSEKINVIGFGGSWKHLVVGDIFPSLGKSIVILCADRQSSLYAYGDMCSILGEEAVLYYPASYRRAYQMEEIDNANVLLRGEVLSHITSSASHKCIVTYADAIFEKVLPQKTISSRSFSIKKGDKIDVGELIDRMEEAGFERRDFVFSSGEYSVRGGIIDIFSYTNDEPYRVELFGDEVESIRTFDIESQLSVSVCDSMTILSNVEEKRTSDTRIPFLDFLPASSIVIADNISSVAGVITRMWDKATDAYKEVENATIRQMRPGDLFIDEDTFRCSLSSHKVIEWASRTYFATDVTIGIDIKPQPIFHRNFDMLSSDLKENTSRGIRNVILCGSSSQAQRLKDIFEDQGSGVKFDIIEGTLHEGFIDISSHLACYTDHQIFERYHRYRSPRSYDKQQALSLSQLSELEIGDYVTHIDHGVARFGGLQKIDAGGTIQEAIKLVYAGGDILYVSIHSFSKISKYAGRDASAPRVDRLGSTAWHSLKERAKKRVKQVAFDLIKLYARRQTVKGYAFSPDNYLQNELEASFIYEDTPDQLRATQAVKRDMESSRPMDRLVCGDVGFGKTEVAIRAAFKAVCDSKQVVVLVPTTILAFQHYRSFISRLKRMPVRVEYLNRFRTAKEKSAILKDLEEGRIDIIIGTHQVVGKNVKFKDLGLLIIDEEHKFGVGVKDKLKTLKTNVDTLTLTATPIPRTLQFSLMAARDLSVIATPPPNRHPINTQVITFDQEVIRDAISYELSRGGQVFFINNRIEDIQELAGMIQRLVPDARIAVGHGQMKGSELENLMLGFMEGEYDVLVSTTIVESGLDVPNANTMFVNNAHMFGLSDLHQMRGRVGRSNKNAFCYYIAPPYSAMTDDARNRLEALEKYSAVGQGINIAMKDLEIRGAGDLLGAEQSGFIADIGFDTYQKILAEAVEELRREEFAEVFEGKENDSISFVPPATQIDTDFELLIPDDYVSSSIERLRLYNTLTSVKSEEELEVFAASLNDRFGQAPRQVVELMDSIRLKWKTSMLGVERLFMKRGVMRLYFPEDSSSAFFSSDVFTRILSWVASHGKDCRLEEKSMKSGRLALILKVDDVKTLPRAIKIINSLYDSAVVEDK